MCINFIIVAYNKVYKLSLLKTQMDNVVAISSDNADLGEFMQMMDVVDVMRRQDKAIQDQLSLDEQKKALSKKLKETYTTMGTEVSEEQLNRAVDNYFSTKWEFEPPKEGFNTSLAKAYIHRGWIATRILIPSVVGLGIISGYNVNYNENSFLWKSISYGKNRVIYETNKPWKIFC